jgi:SNF2 family DNA or RNA helicase
LARFSTLPHFLVSDGWDCHGNAQEKVARLQDLLRKYMLRRVKEDVQNSIGMLRNDVMVTCGH